MPLNSKRQYYLDVARVVAVFAIVLNHAVNRSFAVYHYQSAGFTPSPWPGPSSRPPAAFSAIWAFPCS